MAINDAAMLTEVPEGNASVYSSPTADIKPASLVSISPTTTMFQKESST
jgi:hypothetical protein